jgi:hypothetical protein
MSVDIKTRNDKKVHIFVSVAESTFDDEASDDEFVEEEPKVTRDAAPASRRDDLKIIDLENDDDDEEQSTTFIENAESDDESSSYEKRFVRDVATPTGSAAHSSASSVASPAATPSIGLATHTTTEDEDVEEDDEEEEDATNVTLSPGEVVVVGNDTTFVTSQSPDMSHVSVVVVGGGSDVCVMDSSLSSASPQPQPHLRADIVSRNDLGRSSSSASQASSFGGPIIPPPKSYSSSISDDDRNNDVGSPCSIAVEGTTVDDTEDSEAVKEAKDSAMNGHVDSEEDSGVHLMTKSVDEFQELPHDDQVTKETVVRVLRIIIFFFKATFC